MADTSIHSALIFVGGHCRIDRIPASMRTADLIIAADSGQITAQKCGVTPHIIAGDFDSSPMPEETPAQIIRVPSEKDDTDTMLACDIAIRHGARNITILGGTGGRIDHSLSNLFLLEKLKQDGVSAILCDGDNRARVLSDETVYLSLEGFHYFSLIALDRATASVSGCKYPLSEAPLHRAHPYAVSNEIVGQGAEITVSGGPVLLIESGVSPI